MNEDQFIASVARLAQSYGCQHMVLAFKNPTSGKVRCVQSPGAVAVLRVPLAEYLGVAEPAALEGCDTEWPA